MDWAWTWNIGNDSNFPSGDIHPNANGSKVIASYMASAIRGTYTGRYEAATLTSSSGYVHSNIVASGGMVFATFWGVDGASNAELKAGLKFPSWARVASGSSPNLFRTWGAGLTNSGSAINGWLLTDTDSDTSGAPRISYFGVTAAQAGNTHFQKFLPGAGLNAAAAGVTWTHRFGEHWMTRLGAEGVRYLKDVADSPIVQKKTGYLASASVDYRF